MIIQIYLRMRVIKYNTNCFKGTLKPEVQSINCLQLDIKKVKLRVNGPAHCHTIS